ncbi:MAG: thioredoxin domain-containing protein, partial [Leptospiraceae bacterium]|nr:thioredoxin domain-containing protein [Leptospiraceae bacterium]
MERESFEDEETAAILNRDFVCIKVDREERPDIDRIYMDALHAMDQQGGWPLNMFLTPEKKPIAGGTYFPPVPRYGRRSFKDVLKIIKETWDSRREELIQSSNSLIEFLNSEAEVTTELPSTEAFHKTAKIYEKFFDEVYYGFRTNLTNKFPPNMGLSFLLFYYFYTGNKMSLHMVEKTLEAMRKGGIYDQVGGGLCRYATNQSWLIPHFEKMLYDNSLFVDVLIDAYLLTKKEFFKKSAIDVITYVERDLKLESGAIASAEDADSEGEEGKFYLWDVKEFEEVCGEDAELLKDYWNVEEEGNFEGKNILNQSFHLDFSQAKGILPEDLERVVEENRKKLLERRSKRIRPLRDDKVLTSWNCLYAKALLKAGIALENPEYIERAKEIYEFIKKNLFNKEGRLLRRFRDGEAKYLAYLNDYAELALVSIFLYRATFDTTYLKEAVHLTREIIRLFSSNTGVYYETGVDSETLIRRSIDGYDGVEPSGNSTLAWVFLYLASYGIERKEFTERAEKIFTYFKAELENRGISYSYMLSAYLFYKSDPKEIVIVGSKTNQQVQNTLKLLAQTYLPNAIIAFCEPLDLDESSKYVPVLHGRDSMKDFSVYICNRGVCDLPLHSYSDIQKRLESGK